jgi:hypothetical protein
MTTTTPAIDVRYFGKSVITAMVVDDSGEHWCCWTRTRSWSCQTCDDGCVHVAAVRQVLSHRPEDF